MIIGETLKSNEIDFSRDLMSHMVRTSQRPGGDNLEFVNDVGLFLTENGFSIDTVADPEDKNKSLLIVNIGDVDGEQVLSAISHSDVVGVEGQNWSNDPWILTEEKGLWLGRGVCDTHGSGVSMILAAQNKSVIETLGNNNKYISIIFTYDEEAVSPQDSMRGARLAAGLLGTDPVAKADYFIAGEPTEIDGHPIPMRSHKGRWLANFTATVERSGHVSDDVQNALVTGSGIVHQIGEYAKVLRYGSSDDDDAKIYRPAHSTVQVSAADIKNGDYSTTPSRARFTVDMRTLPDVHELRAREISDLIRSYPLEEGTKVHLEVIKDAPGSSTAPNSPIVVIAEDASGKPSRGFNGGDEGRIMRLGANKDGITIGPGELRFAHMPDEQVKVSSIYNMAKIYSRIFERVAKIS